VEVLSCGWGTRSRFPRRACDRQTRRDSQSRTDYSRKATLDAGTRNHRLGIVAENCGLSPSILPTETPTR